MLGKIAGAAAIGVLLAAGIGYATADEGPDLMDGWQVYDYRAGLDAGINVSHPAVELDGAVWANHRQWSIDDPESPPSILALQRYEKWDIDRYGAVTTNTQGPDLRGRCVSFELQADHLDLKGGGLTFWIMASRAGERWHTELPAVGDQWTPITVNISEVEWRNSWRWDPADPPDLDATLGQANSFGIGIVGFGDEEPTGAIGMRGFEIGC